MYLMLDKDDNPEEVIEEDAARAAFGASGHTWELIKSLSDPKRYEKGLVKEAWVHSYIDENGFTVYIGDCPRCHCFPCSCVNDKLPKLEDTNTGSAGQND